MLRTVIRSAAGSPIKPPIEDAVAKPIPAAALEAMVHQRCSLFKKPAGGKMRGKRFDGIAVHLHLAPSRMASPFTSVSDFTIFSVAALYCLK